HSHLTTYGSRTAVARANAARAPATPPARIDSEADRGRGRLHLRRQGRRGAPACAAGARDRQEPYRLQSGRVEAFRTSERGILAPHVCRRRWKSRTNLGRTLGSIKKPQV